MPTTKKAASKGRGGAKKAASRAASGKGKASAASARKQRSEAQGTRAASPPARRLPSPATLPRTREAASGAGSDNERLEARPLPQSIQFGRPSKLTAAVKETIINAIRIGALPETACALANIDRTTFYDWLRRGRVELERIEKEINAQRKEGRLEEELFVEPIPSEIPFADFSHSIEKALAQAEVRDIQKLFDASIRVDAKNWQIIAWRLERRFSDRWARRIIKEDKTPPPSEPARGVRYQEIYLNAPSAPLEPDEDDELLDDDEEE